MKAFLSVILLSACALLSAGDVRFADCFTDRTLRVDYYHTGHAAEEIVAIDRLIDQGPWAGPTADPLTPFPHGRYAVRLFDPTDGRLVFSRTFDSYFGEYKTTQAALNKVRRTYHESVLLPWPRKPVKMTLAVRQRDNSLQEIFSTLIDPADPTIGRLPPQADIRTYDLLVNGDPRTHLDIAILAEGYTAAEEGKAKADLERMCKVLLGQEPYRRLQRKLNVRGVFRPSAESGCSEPGYGAFRRTALNTTFDSLGLERYLLSEDNRAMRDMAAAVPYDTLAIMVNRSRYGGGGIYNSFCTFTADNGWYEYLFLHEFGHSLVGLADEYYTSTVAYNEFYPKGIEPLEPNITALLDPAALKWRSLVKPGTPLPTPWGKEEFEKNENVYQKKRAAISERIATMRRAARPAEEVAAVENESDQLSRGQAQEITLLLQKGRHAGEVGAFEGAGYSAQGLYRSMADCIMFTKGKKPYCRVCEEAVAAVIRYFSE